jgi:hypothetical protein
MDRSKASSAAEDKGSPEEVELMTWLRSLSLEHILRQLLEAGFTVPTLRVMEPLTLSHILTEAKIPLKDKVTILSNLTTLPATPDNIVLYSPDSKTNPDDGDSDLLIGWIKSIGIAAVLVLLPVLTIGLSSDQTKKHASDNTDDSGLVGEYFGLTTKESYLKVFIPATIFFVSTWVLTPRISMIFASDVMQERSLGINYKESYAGSLTTTGIVAALLLTCVVSAVQSEAPTNTHASLLSQWYAAFLAMSFFFAVSSTAMSAICLTYMQPLDEVALQDFVSIMALYFGELLSETEMLRVLTRHCTAP